MKWRWGNWGSKLLVQGHKVNKAKKSTAEHNKAPEILVHHFIKSVQRYWDVLGLVETKLKICSFRLL